MSKNLKGKRPLLDTNVFVERTVPAATFSRMLPSSVVLYELIAANIDNATLALYSSWKTAFGASNQFITPTALDWFECSKLVRNMLRGSKSGRRGYVKKITSAQQQQNDALIARSAATHNCFVVTSNL